MNKSRFSTAATVSETDEVDAAFANWQNPATVSSPHMASKKSNSSVAMAAAAALAMFALRSSQKSHKKRAARTLAPRRSIFRSLATHLLTSAAASIIASRARPTPPTPFPTSPQAPSPVRPLSAPTRTEYVQPQKAPEKPVPLKASWWRLLKEAASDWMEDKAPRLGAALAYYTVFSIAPILVISISVAGLVFGTEAVNSQITQQMQGFLGKEGAEGVQSMIAAASQRPKTGMAATAIGIVALLFGASGVFGQMKDALNTIWEVEPKPGRGVWGIIKDRFLSFAMVLGVIFLLLVTLLVSTALAAMTSAVGNYIPGPDFVAHALDLVISLGIVTLLFALIFKYLPDVKIGWRDVWLGAAVTAVLFTIGKYAIGVYLGTASFGSNYGAAGSILIVLIWAYYSSQILFFGAELTQAYARMYGSRIEPAEDAVPVTAEARAQQGLKNS